MIAMLKFLNHKPHCLFKSFFFFLVVFFVTPLNLFSQGTLVTGKVTDSTGLPVPGVTILIKGTNTGTSTDNEGNFSLNVTNPNATIVATSLGYDRQEIGLAGRNNIPITLSSATTQLDQVVVVGYGTQ